MSEMIQVPNGWMKYNLGDIRIDNSKNLNFDKIPEKFFELYSIPSFNNQKPEITQGNNIGSNKKTVKSGTVLLSKINPHINRVWIVDNYSQHTQIASPEWILFFPSPKFESKYIFYFLQNTKFRKFINSNLSGIGGSLTRFRPSILDQYKIYLPPLKTQKQIVTKLDHILEELEVKKKEILSLIEQNKERIDFFEKNWMSYVIDREIEKHPQRNEWNVVKLESISELITKGSSPKWQGIQYADHGILFITSENIGNGKLKIQKKKYVETKFNEIQKHSILKRGDLLTNIVGAGIGRSTLFDLDESANINQAVALIRLNNGIEKKFILNVLQSSQIIQFMHGNKVESARPNLSLTQVRNFPIPLPSIDIQKQIIQNIKSAEEKFQLQKKQFENIKNNYESKIKYINHIQSSILDSAFSGKLLN